VGICLPREQLPVAVLAVWKAGAAYVPLDPSFPDDRLAIMAEDAGLRAILTDRVLAHRARSADDSNGAVIVLLDADRGRIDAPMSDAIPPTSPTSFSHRAPPGARRGS
jgi:non-ribosomal peptide synthetase component F